MSSALLNTTVTNGVLVACFQKTNLDDLVQTVEMGSRLRAVAEQAPDGRMLLDFQHVEFLDSSMLGQLFALRKHCEARNIVVKACSLSDNLKKLFEIVRLVQFVELHDDAASAIATFAPPSAPEAQELPDIDALQSAADGGDPAARYELARCYEDGRGVEQNPRQALQLWRDSADAGYAPAQYRVGHAFAYGIEVAQDYDEALRFYTPAADQGHREAQYALGMAYRYGLVENDEPGAAARWYKLAASQGHKMAEEELKHC